MDLKSQERLFDFFFDPQWNLASYKEEVTMDFARSIYELQGLINTLGQYSAILSLIISICLLLFVYTSPSNDD